MSNVHAVFQDGVFRPVGRVDLPDPCEVEFEPRLVASGVDPKAGNDVYDVLAERYASGEQDVAARHDEHQP